MIINESFEIHETLNPAIWNITTKKLLPEVRNKLIEIVSTFEDSLDIPIDIVDIQIVGSNASYNYTSTSDIDLHIIANFEIVSKEVQLLQVAYDVNKANFNKTYDIKIRGLEVELYVQDIKSNIESNGIYSVLDDAWIKEPKPIKSITKHNTEKEIEKWTKHINAALINGDYDQVVATLDNVYLMRKNSIAIDGEYGKGNQIFKELRSLGLIQKLKDKLDELLSKQLSLESLNRGQLVNQELD